MKSVEHIPRLSFSDGRPARVAVVLLCLGLLALLAFLQADQFADDRRLGTQAAKLSELEADLVRFLSLQQDIETGQRGYVLTGEESFLRPFTTASDASASHLKSLETRFEGDPRALARLNRLEDLASRKIAFSRRVIALRDAGRNSLATSTIASGEGEAIMSAMRDTVGQLIDDEEVRVEKLERQSALTRKRGRMLSILAQGTLLVLLIGALVAYLMQLRRAVRLNRLAWDSSARQAAILVAANDALIVIDQHGRIESANPAAEALVGYPRDELLHKPVIELFASPPRASTIRALLARLARQDHKRLVSVHKISGRRRDGSAFDAEISASPVDLADGPRCLLVVRDVTERGRIERLKAEFVATVSHELRTPLTSIAGSLGLIAGGAAGPLEPRAAKLIDIALTNSKRLVRLINDILDIEKIESGKIIFRVRPQPLRPLVEESIQANLAFAGASGVSIALEPGEDDAVVSADHDRLVQVLDNLLSNAVKFSPPGGTVRVAITPGTERHRMTISDTGPGIPAEFQASLFTRFAQADGSSSRNKGGTGLGLAIVKEILDRTGGSIRYDTSPQGTSFHVELAAVQRERPPCLLLVQLDEEVGAQLRKALGDRGMTVDVASEAAALAGMAERRSYDAVVLGLDRDGQGAAGFVQAIRAVPSLEAIPILALAQGHQPGQVSRAVELVDWLSGPPTPLTVRPARQLIRGGDSDNRLGLVLHVEDDEDVLRVVETAFEGKATVTAARDAREARAVLARQTPDLVILDLALPGESGLELLPSLRRADGAPIPVVIYTAADQDPEIASRAVAMLTKSKASLDELVDTVLMIVSDAEAGDR